jgi:hypothetical protein
LFQNREIAAVDDLSAEPARFLNQSPKVYIELGRSARDVEDCSLPTAKKFQHQTHDFARHLLGSGRTRIDVAVETGLVTAVANIDLQRFKLAAADGGKANLVEQWSRIAHRQPQLGQVAMAPTTTSYRQKVPHDKSP